MSSLDTFFFPHLDRRNQLSFDHACYILIFFFSCQEIQRKYIRYTIPSCRKRNICQQREAPSCNSWCVHAVCELWLSQWGDGPCTSMPRIKPWHLPTRAPRWYRGCLGESCTRSLSDVSYPGWVFIGLNFATYWCQQMLYKYSHFEKAAFPPPHTPLACAQAGEFFSPNLTGFCQN